MNLAIDQLVEQLNRIEGLLLRQVEVPRPQWADGAALAEALGSTRRAPEYWRKEGVIPVDGVVCRLWGGRYQYDVSRCVALVDAWKALSTEERKAIKEGSLLWP